MFFQTCYNKSALYQQKTLNVTLKVRKPFQNVNFSSLNKKLWSSQNLLDR